MYSNLHKCWKMTHVIIGPPNVGKTKLFEYYTSTPIEEEKTQKNNIKKQITTQTSKFQNGYNSERTSQPTIGMDLSIRKLIIDKQPVTLDIWDTAGIL